MVYALTGDFWDKAYAENAAATLESKQLGLDWRKHDYGRGVTLDDERLESLRMAAQRLAARPRDVVDMLSENHRRAFGARPDLSDEAKGS